MRVSLAVSQSASYGLGSTVRSKHYSREAYTAADASPRGAEDALDEHAAELRLLHDDHCKSKCGQIRQ